MSHKWHGGLQTKEARPNPYDLLPTKAAKQSDLDGVLSAFWWCISAIPQISAKPITSTAVEIHDKQIDFWFHVISDNEWFLS